LKNKILKNGAVDLENIPFKKLANGLKPVTFCGGLFSSQGSKV